MNTVKYFFSCIITPITGLLNFGKYMRTENGTKQSNDEEEPEPSVSNSALNNLSINTCQHPFSYQQTLKDYHPFLHHD